VLNGTRIWRNTAFNG